MKQKVTKRRRVLQFKENKYKNKTHTWAGLTVTAVTLHSWSNQRAVSPSVHGSWISAVSMPVFHTATTRHRTRGPC